MNEVGIFELSKQINNLSLLRSEPGKQGSNRKTLKCYHILLFDSHLGFTNSSERETVPEQYRGSFSMASNAILGNISKMGTPVRTSLAAESVELKKRSFGRRILD